MKIGDVARQAGIAPSAIRYYERIGLLPAARRAAGQRTYDESVVPLLRFIRLAKATGFGLDEIREVLTREGDAKGGGAGAEKVRAKIAELEQGIRAYGAMKRALEELLACGCLEEVLEGVRELPTPPSARGADRADRSGSGGERPSRRSPSSATARVPRGAPEDAPAPAPAPPSTGSSRSP